MADENKFQKLNLGCGHEIMPGWINCDLAPLPGVDACVDLQQFPWPFPDNSFNEIRAANVLEHLPNLIKTLEEIHRISAPGAKIYFSVPYWNSFEAITDPTHRQPFNEYTFEFFDPSHSRCKNRPYYSKARFKIERIGFYIRPGSPYWNVPGLRPSFVIFNRIGKRILGALAAHFCNIIIGLEIYLECHKERT